MRAPDLAQLRTDLQLAPDELLPLTLTGQPVLHRRAAEVTAFDAALAALVEAMFETMYAAPGVGLAAPQVGVGLRVFVYDCPGRPPGHVVNPLLDREPGELLDEPEGCLSVPGPEFSTPRAARARVRGVDLRGQPVDVEGEGLLARCLQHEVDHLDGLLYLDRLGGRVRKQALREVREAPWYGQAHRRLVRATEASEVRSDLPPEDQQEQRGRRVIDQ